MKVSRLFECLGWTLSVAYCACFPLLRCIREGALKTDNFVCNGRVPPFCISDT
jgi:hypothetical protein